MDWCVQCDTGLEVGDMINLKKKFHDIFIMILFCLFFLSSLSLFYSFDVFCVVVSIRMCVLSVL